MDLQHSVELGNPSKWHIVTRHEPRVELLKAQGINGPVHDHIDIEKIGEQFKAGDVVVGVLPIADYGEILESDWGDHPPQDVIQFMKEEHDYETPIDDF